MLKAFTEKIKLTPALGTSFTNWMMVLIENRGFTIKKLFRATLITLLSVIGIPFRILERLRYEKRIKNVPINKSPIFIIGHWRSGTTHLHNLLVQDPRFGFISMLQAMFPRAFLITDFFKWFLDIFMPETRPMDNMKITPHKPQEDELAMSNFCPYSFYKAFYFPESMIKYFHRYLEFNGNQTEIIEKWKKNYLYLLKKATYNMGGRRLILKNPSNTPRIRVLLEMFPDAKFIHIHRNPYVIYPSMIHFYETAIKFFILRPIPEKDIDRNIRMIYKLMMENYFEEKERIPKKNLVEISFKELESKPLEVLKRIYDTFHLGRFDQNRQRFERYLESRSDYQKNIYKLDEETVQKIKASWAPIIEKLGYDLPRDLIKS